MTHLSMLWNQSRYCPIIFNFATLWFLRLLNRTFLRKRELQVQLRRRWKPIVPYLSESWDRNCFPTPSPSQLADYVFFLYQLLTSGDRSSVVPDSAARLSTGEKWFSFLREIKVKRYTKKAFEKGGARKRAKWSEPLDGRILTLRYSFFERHRSSHRTRTAVPPRVIPSA